MNKKGDWFSKFLIIVLITFLIFLIISFIKEGFPLPW
jgi:nucleoside recognition membrane protein YjiH